MSNTKTVAVIGLGYIGLPTAAALATNGWTVIGVDVSGPTVDAVNRGEVPFVEPDLGTFVAVAVKQGTLRAQKETPSADVFIVAVPTPFAEDYAPDLSYIEAAADGIAPRLSGGELVILESTSPPGATCHIAKRILADRPDLSLEGGDGRPVVHFAHCPERVLPGRVMIELVTNDRIVGGLTSTASDMARNVYATFCKGELHTTDAMTAELAKLTENSFRDVNIAFANELSMISDRLGVDVWELIALANKHPRVNILEPGPGVGGHCIAVDPWFIVSSTPEQSRLIRTAREVNDAKPEYVLRQIEQLASGIAVPRIAVLGLAFKPDIDDLRESPAVRIVEGLAQRLQNGLIRVVEPHVCELPARLGQFANVTLANAEDALTDADVAVLLVAHSAFRSLDPELIKDKHIVDTKGFWGLATGKPRDKNVPAVKEQPL
ncbi:UDP-N-acetyl-D-mannosamine dehydrogenase [Segeticoccus rhizosphaerae]|uniref:UDP-N-acetyl-D-mannosamine dehydrogenase n=1 Tax=Segeticoccus rhizosphaerae TaxID=1104777 RepID=UPI0012651F1E|nr:UDP-N-acetyl-D-mannosamine dehydrogenase [Segeticoccus rhizosphaerae]